jgi:hypothetical protein
VVVTFAAGWAVSGTQAQGAVRNHFKHSVELVDREGDIVDVLAAVEEVARSVRCRVRVGVLCPIKIFDAV